MSAAIAQIDANLARVHARLKAQRWDSEERRASLACVAAMGRGDKTGSRAHEAWAEVCALRVQAWTEEATK
jgi:hypothetical protein